MNTARAAMERVMPPVTEASMFDAISDLDEVAA